MKVTLTQDLGIQGKELKSLKLIKIKMYPTNLMNQNHKYLTIKKTSISKKNKNSLDLQNSHKKSQSRNKNHKKIK